MPPDNVDISNLMDRALSGDDGAFGELSLVSQDELLRFALAHGLSFADSAEATQEALLRAYRARRRWRAGSSVMPWLYAIAMNVVREIDRKRRREAGSMDPNLLAGVLEASSTPTDSSEAETHTARLRQLAAAIQTLPPRQREAVACRFLRRMSERDTAAAMGCAEGTVKATVHTALKGLRDKLKQEESSSQVEHGRPRR